MKRMARLADRYPDNATGDFYVDSSCIDCDRCRQLAPATFAASAQGHSYVHAQPADAASVHRALLALVTCPTASIGTTHKHDVTRAARALPEWIADDVYDCGFASADSFGATSYLIRRGDGNVLVDSPRAARGLMARMEELGGVARMFLTHRDDVADHELFRARFGCDRIMHAADARGIAVERTVDGDAPVRVDGDLVVIPVPGHTRGSAALLYREQFLFSGDHLWWDDDENSLDASRGVCWYSWTEQTRSMERLLDFPFQWVLPGHGRRHHAAERILRAELETLIQRMRRQR